MKVLFQQGNYRIIEQQDDYLSVKDFEFGPETMALAEQHGVYGYELQRWNPEIDVGWEHIDSCWGFVGQYSETDLTFNHYIVDEMKGQIK